jgi:hypothetical protein
MSATQPEYNPDRLTRAHVVPFAVFMGFMILLQLVAVKSVW